MAENLETQVAVLTNELKHNNALLGELLKIVKGDNGCGLMTRVAIIEKHPQNCDTRTSVRWLTWGVRGIYTIIILAFIAAWISKVAGA
jgi:5'-3' exonuclease